MIKGHIIVKLSHTYFIILGNYVRELHIRVLLELILATHLMSFRDHRDQRPQIIVKLSHAYFIILGSYVRDSRTSSYFGKYRGI
jgi:hypothetical protein